MCDSYINSFIVEDFAESFSEVWLVWEKEAEKQEIVQDILLEVNIGGEEAKSGFAPAQLEDAARAAQAMSHVRVRGLMTIPPADSDRDTNIRYFQEDVYKRQASRLLLRREP